jgi:hypothetical protein
VRACIDLSACHRNVQKSYVIDHRIHRHNLRPIVTKLVSDLLAPFTLGAASALPHLSKLPDIDLDQASLSLPFLGSGIPFYQFYTDFLALYDAISFSNPSFAPLLLPPLALTYPIDYRRILWAGFAHVLCTDQKMDSCASLWYTT